MGVSNGAGAPGKMSPRPRHKVAEWQALQDAVLGLDQHERPALWVIWQAAGTAHNACHLFHV